MRAIFNRLRRLEQAAVPDERAHAAAEAILEARRHSPGSRLRRADSVPARKLRWLSQHGRPHHSHSRVANGREKHFWISRMG